MHVEMRRRHLFSRRTRRGALAVGAVSLLASCGGGGDGSTTSDDVTGTVRVFAAASLTDVMDELARDFEEAEPGVDVEINVAGSSTLREQILEGAPADVFAAASHDVVEPLREGGEISMPSQVFAANSLVIATPAGNPGGVVGVESFADDDLLLGACAPGVPCGDLAATAFDLAGVEAALDTEEPNVRALLTKISSGDLDAGLVYATDVAAHNGDVELIPLPVGIEAINEYPVAVLDRAANPAAAEAFVDFLVAEPGRSLLAVHGFEVP